MSEITTMKNAVNHFVNLSQANSARNPEDYINPSDGLLYCGKCHTAKQCRVSVLGEEITPYCSCRCDQERYAKEKAKIELDNRIADCKKLWTLSNTPESLLRSSFDNYRITPENQESYAKCRHYAERFEKMSEKSQGLLLWGGVGTGKTFSAACIANCLVNKGISVFMTSFARLLGSGKGFDIDPVMTDGMKRAELLIIDDLGTERSTDFALEKVYGIIDDRYASECPMILTTNLSLSEMKRCTDIRYTRIYERILQVCHPVKFDGISVRKSEAANRFKEMEEFLK